VQKELDHSPLLDWVWEYFTGEKAGQPQRQQDTGDNMGGKSSPIILSGEFLCK
jgi:hypothetical protein